MIKHASIVPLIGGMTIASQNIFGSKPKWFESFEPFQKNDSHIVNHYKDISYNFIGERGLNESVDVIGTTCPCAGLSALSAKSSADNPLNEWMIKTSEYVLSNYKPTVFWGENAPRLSTKMGKPVLDKLYKVAQDNGYTISLYKTKSFYHNNPQIRERTFYFFWKGNKAPVFDYYKGEDVSIEDLLKTVPKDATLQTSINPKIPSKEDPLYRYLLEVVERCSHTEFASSIDKSINALDWLISKQVNLVDVVNWMRKQGYDNEANKIDRINQKRNAQLGYMNRTTIVPKGIIGAFVGSAPYLMTVPHEDRYINYREAMTVMGLPFDFELLDPKRFINHVCQNVPVKTAEDMCRGIKDYLDGKLYTLEVNNGILIQNNMKDEYKVLTYDEPNLNTYI